MSTDGSTVFRQVLVSIGYCVTSVCTQFVLVNKLVFPWNFRVIRVKQLSGHFVHSKDTVVHVDAIKPYGIQDVQLHVFLNSAMDGGAWLASCPGRFTLRHPEAEHSVRVA
jgi:hypothetical protein